MFALTALAGLAACDSSSSTPDNSGTLAFTNRLRIPPLAEPSVAADGTKRFALTLQSGLQTAFLPGKTTATWGVNGAYLGPTLRAARGDKVSVSVVNKLAEPSTLHWHGMHLPAAMDGGPHQAIAPGATWTPHWTVNQDAATAWYHPHPHGKTALHVYRGIAGLFLIDDDGNLPLPSRYGVDDIPLIVQDKSFTDDGQLVEDERKAHPVWGPTFGLLGDHILVNGTHDPFVDVTTTLVRFRILNASNARTYNFEFSDRRGFQVIAGDAGLLPAPATVTKMTLSPGERAEIVAEFAGGEQVILRSAPGDQQLDAGNFDILRIHAAAQLTTSPSLPTRLSTSPTIEPRSGATVRRFTLSGSSVINGKTMDMSRIDEVVPAGALEIWEVDNIVYAHNFHIHEVAFRILDIGGRTPPPYQQGPKDTVFIPGHTKVRLAVQFGQYVDPASPYMYHCHVLFHEDKGMMGQFVIVTPGTEAQTPRAVPAGHHHR